MTLGLGALVALTACAPPDPCDPEVVATGVVCTVAGTGVNGFDGDGRDARESRLYFPTGVARDPEGRLVIVDFNNMRVRLREDDGTLGTIAGNGVHGWSEAGAVATRSPLENPIDVAFDGDGVFFVAALHEARVLRVDPDGTIAPYAGSGALGYGADGGPALLASMGEPGGIALSSDGWLFVADTANHCVRAVDPASGTISTLAGAPEAGFADGVGEAARFHFPQRVHADDDHVWVADTGNHAIRRVDRRTREVVTLAGDGTAGYVDGALDAARLATPMGLDVHDGVVIFADAGSDTVRAIGPAGMTTLAGDAQEGFVDGEAAAARFAYPYDVSAGPDGVYVADYRNGAVRWMR